MIVTLRADFHRPLLYPDPGELMRQRTAVVLPLARRSWSAHSEARAEGRGEPGAEVDRGHRQGRRGAAGALPLLQYAMTELFERRSGRSMTLAAYNESGGVTGALARRAGTDLYGELGEEEA